MNGYDGEYSSVNVYGFFNGWCASCNEMTDEDGDGVYTATVRATEGEMEYKFTLDGGVDLRKCSKPNSLHQDDRRLHQPLAQVESDTEFPVVCFNACGTWNEPLNRKQKGRLVRPFFMASNALAAIHAQRGVHPPVWSVDAGSTSMITRRVPLPGNAQRRGPRSFVRADVLHGIAKTHFQRPLNDVEHFVFVFVRMPHKLLRFWPA